MLEKSSLSPYAKEQIRREFEKKGRNRIADTASNVELSPKRKPIRSYEGATFNTPVRVDIFSTRCRKTDIDGISGKAALDGIVDCGILKDDSPDQIERYQIHKPTISKVEKTLIVIEEI